MSMLDFIGTILIVATTVVVINAGISSLAITRVQRLALALAVGVWVGLAAAFASSGLLAVAKPVPYIGAFVALPLLAAAALVAYSPQWRAALIGLPMPLLVGLNIGRLVGVLFLFLAADGRLGGPFPYSAGWGDVIVGTLAVPALWFAARPFRRHPASLRRGTSSGRSICSRRSGSPSPRVRMRRSRSSKRETPPWSRDCRGPSSRRCSYRSI